MRGTETITVRRLTPDDWTIWRDIRLVSLADAPHAFGSSLAREQAFAEADWRLRLDTERGALAAVAEQGERVVGSIGGYTPDGADAVLLIAMWAHPDARGQGVGDALVREVLAWATENGWPEVQLRVADGNTAARRLFERNGFVPTGRRDTLESNPAVYTEFMARRV